VSKDYFIKLTLAVYRVTELFPSQEPLKFSLREKANQILADAILFFSENPINLKENQKERIKDQILRNIEVLEGYFEVAKTQQWVKDINFFVLKKEYDKLKEEVLRKNQKSLPIFGPENSLQLPLESLRKERCKRILEILQKKGRAQIWEFKEIFPQLSKRTLRRDFEYLLKKGLVERIGEGKMTYYRLPNSK